MLKRLIVKNFAIIEDIDISFKDGLTVLTGETGAGKSLIIDSISLLLGTRANLEMVRNGEDKAEIKGIFSVKSTRLSSLLYSLDVPLTDDEITIYRVISATRSQIRINDKVVSLGDLKNVAVFLADIHEQFDAIKLLNKDNYLEIVDDYRYEIIKEYKDKYLSSLEVLKQKEMDYLALKAKIQALKDEREEREFELKELTALDLSMDEDVLIKEKIEVLRNYDTVYALIEETKEHINGDTLDNLYFIKNNLAKLGEYQTEYNELSNYLDERYIEIETLFDDLKRKFSRVDYDPNELEELENRESDIRHIMKKYNKTNNELVLYKEELDSLLKSDDDLELDLKEKYDVFKKAYDETYVLASDLDKVRHECAKVIEKELMNNLNDLALKSVFKIDITKREKDKDYSLAIFQDTGINEVDFLIETNIGEGIKPLAKVISGGEMSRVMLAIKALFIKAKKISTVIFDEVDTGISGEIARKVALKIHDISLTTQVISITHLPQVASLSTHHIKIQKTVIKGRTYTEIKELTLDEKIYEIASMISGGKVTESQLNYAREMVLNKEN